ncbi:uncharacterized protein LOC124441316 [Xenia sp. Carnegie-2017]|uniref:uncharacterized protein LOC124441316 n=1 Tax=Xenia sp. Carnegie-2017 TaxID=2897299 RepID=UPI001F04D33A|nr:uncharacterized protein LOC124441316 [Xenia sp. Carnegie-2017]
MAFFLYFTYILSSFLAGIFVYYFINRSKKSSSTLGRCSSSDIYTSIKKLLPLDQNYWNLKYVEDGLRVWQSCYYNNCFATSAMLPASLKTAKDILTEPSLINEWNIKIKFISRTDISSGGASSSTDVISVTESLQGFSKFLTAQSKTISRTWNFEENVAFWLHTSTIDPKSTDSYFTLFMVFPIKEKEEQCQVFVVTETISQLDPSNLTSSVAGLRDFVIQRCTGVLLPGAVKDMKDGNIAKNEEKGDVSEDIVENVDVKNSSFSSEEVFDEMGVYFFPDKDFQSKYKPSIDVGLKTLLEYYYAKANQDGWNFFGNMKNVEIMKKPASPGFSIWDCSKGTTEINVPVHYLMAYLDDLNRTVEYDDMFERGHVVEHVGDLTKIVYIEYRGIWPVSNRDFCSYSATRVLKNNIVVYFASHVKHPSCPANKKIVRGKILIGGYVMEIISENPPRIKTSYITHVDLEGSVPSRIVNKITASQPASVGLVKKFVEKMYEDEVDNPNRPASKFKMDALVLKEKLERAKEQLTKRSTDQPSTTSKEPPEVMSSPAPPVPLVNGDVHPESYTQSLTVSDESRLSPSINGTYVDQVGLEYKTIGNQACAALLQESFEVTEVDISKPNSSNVPDQWRFQETERNVLVFRKIHKSEKMHSFAGKGLIACPPPKVWEILCNPQLTSRYNNMLKETRILERLSETQTIEYIYFQTEKCFQKHSRDFVLLKTTRKEKDKYVLSYVSVDYPNAPPSKKDAKRGKIIYSGWVIEPILHNGQLYSTVTYMAQVNPGGSYPAMIINAVSQKQPLCVFYLRRMIENPNDNFTQSVDVMGKT